jgi:hypothetical protein
VERANALATRIDDGRAVSRGTRLLDCRRCEACERIFLGRQGWIRLGIMWDRGMFFLVLCVYFVLLWVCFFFIF